MLKLKLLGIIANGENSGVEFKRDDIRPEQLGKEVVALANHQGGIILIGVEDDGTISGIKRDDLETWIFDTVFDRYVHPMILPFYETVLMDDGKSVAVISFPQGTSKPYVLRHNGREEIYIRAGQHPGWQPGNSRPVFLLPEEFCILNFSLSPAQVFRVLISSGFVSISQQ
ncbi:AlbA family DNA-binding domain-containing protein [Methanospirillum sp.]